MNSQNEITQRSNHEVEQIEQPIATQEGSSQFKQHILKSWQPVPTLSSTIVIFSIFTVFFLTMGLLKYFYGLQIVEQVFQYDNICPAQASCQIQIEITKDIPGPTFVYCELTNYYQNHRRYVKSKDDQQLEGTNKTGVGCEPIVYNSQLPQFIQNLPGNENIKANPNGPAIPCGVIAATLFNDTYTLTSQSGTQIIINETGIAWPADLSKYKNVGTNYKQVQWTDMTNEHFMVWMRTAALPTFRKLWGRIVNGLPKGTYTLQINNQYDVSQFSGTKSFVLENANVFGGKNSFIVYSYIAIGSICGVITIVFGVMKFLKHNRIE